MSAPNEGGGGSGVGGGGDDGSTTPMKRKSPSPSPGTDTSQTQRGTSTEDAGSEKEVSSTIEHDDEPPVEKRRKIDSEDTEDTLDTPPLPQQETEATSQKEPEPNNDDPTGDGAGDGEEKKEPPATKKPNPNLCGICNTQPGKYKCPRCPLKYCSVGCNKIHKENHPPPPPPTSKPQQPDNTNDTNTNTTNAPNLKKDPYQVLLHHRDKFDHLLRRFPGLERVLNNIQKCTLPPPETPSSTSSTGGVPAAILQQTGGVSGFSPSLLSSSNYYGNKNRHNKNTQPHQIWTGEVGLRKGAEALKKARTDPGIHGDGVREFCELVMHLLNNPSLAGDTQTTVPNVTSLVREEVVADQTQAIQQLLQEEGSGDDL